MNQQNCAQMAVSAGRWAWAAIVIMGLLVGGCRAASHANDVPDTFIIHINEALHSEHYTGRLVLMFITETDRRWSMRQPLRGPWLENPQPIMSWPVEQWDGSEPIEFDGRDAALFGGAPETFNGPVRVQALLHVNDNLPRLVPSIGSLGSDVVTYDADAESADRIEINLNQRVEAVPQVAQPTNLRTIQLRSDLLSAALDNEIHHWCAVVLPRAYDERADVRWPVVFVIPDWLDNSTHSAIEQARTLLIPGVEDIAPNAVYVVLDPQTAWGHHGFVDSTFHGPRLTALITELLPHLHKEFRLQNMREARLVAGIGLGGWSALWMTLQQPDVFGGCWATAPTPVDFAALQNINLYDMQNAFRDASGQPHWAFRRTGMAIDQMIPSATSQQMWRMELAIDPAGRSGGLWQTWNRMYSPVNPDSGELRSIFDAQTGLINQKVAAHWQQYDIAHLVHSDPQRYLSILAERVHLFCGELDSFYFDRAVRRLRDNLLDLGEAGASAAASILMIEGATHDNAQRYVLDEWNEQMREHLKRHGIEVN